MASSLNNSRKKSTGFLPLMSGTTPGDKELEEAELGGGGRVKEAKLSGGGAWWESG